MANPLTLNFGFALLYPNQAQKDVVVNQDLAQIDSLLQFNAIDLGTNTPPGSPADQDKHIIGTAPTGVWSGHANALAIWQANGSFWQFYAPVAGWVAFNAANQQLYAWSGAAWLPLASAGTGQIGALAPNAGSLIVGNGSAWTEETGAQFINNNASTVLAINAPFAAMYALIFGG